MIVLPQRRRANAHRALLASLQVGDEVITIGGILGTIRDLDDEKIQLEVAEGVVVTDRPQRDRAGGRRHRRRSPRATATARSAHDRPPQRHLPDRARWSLVVGTFVYTLASNHEPVLGLDLQGGTSVVLSPVGEFKSDTLDVAIDIIRNRVDTFGTLEPEISRQGSDIVIDLPGVKDRDKAIALVGKTAELRFRPVLSPLPSVAAQERAACHHDDRPHRARPPPTTTPPPSRAGGEGGDRVV